MVLAQLVAWSAASAASPYRSPLDPAFSPDGKTLAVTDHTAATVSFIDPASRQVTASVALAGPPAGLAWAPDGKRLFVSESGAHRIAEVDVAAAKVVRHLATGRYPRGLALASRRGLLVATDSGLDQVRLIDLASGTTTATLPTGRQPTYVAVTPDETTALVSNLLPATAATAADHAIDITAVDLQTLQVKPAIRLPLGSTNGRMIAISGDGATAYLAHTFGRFNLPTTQLDRGWVNTNALSIIDVRAHKLTATVLLDQVMDGAADPWGVAVHPSGALLFVTLAGTHQVAVIDLEKLPALLQGDTGPLANDLAALYRNNLIRRVNLPVKGPRGIAVSPDGSLVAIAGYFSGAVVLCDPRAANPVAVPLGAQPDPDPARLGEIAFHDAGHCFQRWLSCATCHPDGRADGLNWDLL
ncbi:MAG: YncE family protein, partial [Akkermansiaceae bacterium]|nr:YncE family protein [Akkermansiaceae bacterium]